MCSTAHYCLCPQNIVWLLIFRLTTCFLVLLLPYNCLLCWKHKQRKCCFVSLVYLCFYKWNPQSIQSIWMCFTKNRWTVVAQLWGCILNAGIIISGLSTLCLWRTHRHKHTHASKHTLSINKIQAHTHAPHTVAPGHYLRQVQARVSGLLECHFTVFGGRSDFQFLLTPLLSASLRAPQQMNRVALVEQAPPNVGSAAGVLAAELIRSMRSQKM